MTLQQAAQPLSNIARIWRTEGRTGEALAMARLAVRGEERNPAYLALYARLLMDSGAKDKALRVMQAAADLDAEYRDELTELQARQAGPAE